MIKHLTRWRSVADGEPYIGQRVVVYWPGPHQDPRFEVSTWTKSIATYATHWKPIELPEVE